MVMKTQSRWAPRGAGFVLWALVTACAAFWGLKFSARPAGPLPLSAGPGGMAAADPAAVARLLGAGAAAAATAAPVASLSSRFALVGVVAGPSSSGASHTGAALIAVDGKPARPYRVGAKVDEGLVLQSVAPRRAVLAADASSPAAVTLEMPAFKK